MIGMPTETKEDIIKTIEFAKKLPLTDFKVNYCVPYPGTEMYRTAAEYGCIQTDWVKMQLHTKPCFIPNGLTEEDLVNLNKRAFREFYLRPKVIMEHIKICYL